MTPPTGTRGGVLVHEHRKLDGKTVKIEETEDYWIIPDCILTTDGVMNRARKLREELTKTWMLAEMIPFVHEHPGDQEYGLVIDERRIGGYTCDIRYVDATGDVIGTRYLAKHGKVPGFQVTEENVRRNAALIAALRDGQMLETSIGFWSTDEWLNGPMKYEGPNTEFAGQEYDRIQRTIIYDHDASVPVGACGERCTFGRAQGSDHARALHERRHKTTKDGHIMEPNLDCNDKKQILDAIAKISERVEQVAKDATASPAVTPDAIKQAVQEALKNAPAKDEVAKLQKQLDELTSQQKTMDKARLDTKRLDLAKLLHPMGDAKRHADEAAKLDSFPEAALDLMIQREKEFGSRADNTLLDLTRPDPSSVKDGIVATRYGYTVVDHKATSKLLPGAN